MKIFISQPMKGKSVEEVKAERRFIEERLILSGHEVIDSVIAGTPPETHNDALWYLGASLQLLATADAVYFMDGWQDARGCKMEHEACESYNVTILKD